MKFNVALITATLAGSTMAAQRAVQTDVSQDSAASFLQCLIDTGIAYTVYTRPDGILSVLVPVGRGIESPGIDGPAMDCIAKHLDIHAYLESGDYEGYRSSAVSVSSAIASELAAQGARGLEYIPAPSPELPTNGSSLTPELWNTLTIAPLSQGRPCQTRGATPKPSGSMLWGGRTMTVTKGMR
ncbi:hypothetical protein ANO11243_052090 [Dothideomycetidae sp. 11243]|nr:hypothetical protein ANO11243_052090 [fungal sp. No.11243]